ncbi:N-formyl peptide receptor 2 [Biomphalaria pfeifferi]|uniref:N-formyl peptide receptor 2 n=1 Tax=Biomphalaria pfeifferi TaxID=112525 RepID=A0AAD8BNX0_BIOPF|nr:N-formyl peptide receptor 2 [Biomphalaria pfeifferi]
MASASTNRTTDYVPLFIEMFDQTLVTNEALSWFTLVVDGWASFVVAFLGIFTNALTIAVFTRMGFKETVNITMTTITFWDMVRVLCGSIHRCYSLIALVSESLGRSWQNITATNLVYLHNIASNIAYALGSYVAIERCLCVRFPLKIKLMLSPMVTLTICVTVAIVVFAMFFPSILFLNYRWVSAPDSKQPVAKYEISDFYKLNIKSYVEFYQYINFACPMVNLVTMVISSLVILFQLRKASKFRARSQLPDAKATVRDGQVVKMLLMVIASYITVLLPRVIFYITQLLVPEFFLLKHYNNVFSVIVSLALFLDFINSSIGILIFYSMSSKFRRQMKSTSTVLPKPKQIFKALKYIGFR